MPGVDMFMSTTLSMGLGVISSYLDVLYGAL